MLMFFLVTDFLILLILVNVKIWKKFLVAQSFQFLLGLSWISFILWVRLFREYLPKEWPELLALPLWRTGYLSLIFLGLEIFAWHQIFFPIAKVSTMTWIVEKLPGKKLLEFLFQAPAYVFPYVWTRLSGKKAEVLKQRLIWAMDFLHRRGGRGYYAWILPIMVALVPLWIVGIIFAWEVLIQGRLKYFYLLFPLLLIPQLGRAFLSVTSSFAQLELDHLNQYLDITPIGEDCKLRFKISLPLKKQLEIVRVWEISWNFSIHERLLDGVKNRCFRFSAPFLWALYLGGWGSILFHQIEILLLNYPWYF